MFFARRCLTNFPLYPHIKFWFPILASTYPQGPDLIKLEPTLYQEIFMLTAFLSQGSREAFMRLSCKHLFFPKVLEKISWDFHVNTFSFPKVLEKIFKWSHCFYFFFIICPLKGVWLFIWTNLNPLYTLCKGDLCKVWLKLAPWFWRSCRCETFTDRQTTDVKQNVIRKAHLSFQPGELKFVITIVINMEVWN